MHFACSPFLPAALPHRQGLSFSLYLTRQQSSPFVRRKDKTASFTDVYKKVAGLVERDNDSDNDGLVEVEDKAVEFPNIYQLLQVIKALQRLSLFVDKRILPVARKP